MAQRLEIIFNVRTSSVLCYDVIDISRYHHAHAMQMKRIRAYWMPP